MVVRRGGLEDIDAIYALELQSFSTPWSKDAIEKEINNPIATYFVIENDEEMVGYMAVWKVLDEGEITHIAVHQGYRRSGVATKLIEALLQWGEEALQVIRLEVRTSNHAAQKLYEKNGFEIIGTRKNYYTQPIEDAILMNYYYN